MINIGIRTSRSRTSASYKIFGESSVKAFRLQTGSPEIAIMRSQSRLSNASLDASIFVASNYSLAGKQIYSKTHATQDMLPDEPLIAK